MKISLQTYLWSCPQPILAELPLSARIYITFFTKQSVNSEGSLQTARQTDGWEEKCVRQKHSCTFPNLKVILKPLSVSKLFCFILSLCQSFFTRKLCNNFLLDQKGQHQRAVWLQSALSSAPLLMITIESKNEDLQMCQMRLLKVSTPNLFCCSFWFPANPPNITHFWILINAKKCFLMFQFFKCNI